MKFFKWAICLIAITIGTPVLIGACGGGGPEELEIPVKVEQEQLNPETVRVRQGDMVTLKIDADEGGEFHLHGYDKKMDVEPRQVANFNFVADATGRFPITFHAQGEEVGSESEAEHEEDEGGETTIGRRWRPAEGHIPAG